ncbi:hypothetical protein LguiA_019338 [Lonicera macranthoides]
MVSIFELKNQSVGFTFLKKGLIGLDVTNCICIYVFCIYYSMDIKTASRVQERTKASAFNGVGGGHYVSTNIVCKYWLSGRCNRNPCRFLHGESSPPQPKQPRLFKRPSSAVNEDNRTCFRSNLSWRNPNYSSSKNTLVSCESKLNSESHQKVLMSEGAVSGKEEIQKTQRKLCKFWVTNNCVQGDKCKDLHSWFSGDGFSLLAKLEGHNKAVTGITLPFGSQNLLSSSKDKTVRVWNCNTGQCDGIINFDCESGTLISEGPCIFLGLRNAVKAWNIQSNDEMTLTGSGGLIYSMVVGNDMLFAGTEDGTILCWRFNSEANSSELFASLKGHSGAVISLTVGANKLYSGSKDSKIRVWDLETLQCNLTLNGHDSSVTSLLCWDSFLLSGSMDNTIKVWAATDSGNLEVVYEHNEEDGVLALCGIHDAEAKPILLCSCKDNNVHLYDLPSFKERGRIFSKREVESVQIGPGGLFFTGDATGQLFVWRLHGEVATDGV